MLGQVRPIVRHVSFWTDHDHPVLAPLRPQRLGRHLGRRARADDQHHVVAPAADLWLCGWRCGWRQGDDHLVPLATHRVACQRIQRRGLQQRAGGHVEHGLVPRADDPPSAQSPLVQRSLGVRTQAAHGVDASGEVDQENLGASDLDGPHRWRGVEFRQAGDAVFGSDGGGHRSGGKGKGQTAVAASEATVCNNAAGSNGFGRWVWNPAFSACA